MNQTDEQTLRILAEMRPTSPLNDISLMSIIARAIIELRERHDKLVESVISNP